MRRFSQKTVRMVYKSIALTDSETAHLNTAFDILFTEVFIHNFPTPSKKDFRYVKPV